MAASIKRLPAAFYCSVNGVEPVREWLRALPSEDRRIIGCDIALVEFGWPTGMPLCRPLGNGLWEVRSTLTTNRIARVIFCLNSERMILLHAFIKKTQKTPKAELDIAERRKKDVKR